MLLEALHGKSRASKVATGCLGWAASAGVWRRKGYAFFSVHIYLRAVNARSAQAVTVGGGEVGNYCQAKPGFGWQVVESRKNLNFSRFLCQTRPQYCTGSRCEQSIRNAVHVVWLWSLHANSSQHLSASCHPAEEGGILGLTPAMHFLSQFIKPARQRAGICCFSHSPWQNIFLFQCNSF